MSAPRRVEELRNIGATIAQRLIEVGVFTEHDLRLIGAVEAHRRIRDRYPEKTLPVCYYLYSFEAALCDVHWDDLPEPRKRVLRNQICEQDGTGQPATRPESKSEGSDKPQPEAEGRSR